MREIIALREAMNRVFDDAFTCPHNVGSVTDMPNLDMYQMNEEEVIEASLPILKTEAVDLNATGETLTLRREYMK